MPFYEYRCQEHGRFEVKQPIFDKHEANCPNCGKPAERRISLLSLRIAEPLTIYQELPNGQGYAEIDKLADSGISPKPGQPYTHNKEV